MAQGITIEKRVTDCGELFNDIANYKNSDINGFIADYFVSNNSAPK